MKRWTVMLVPRDKGTTKRVNINAAQMWLFGLVMVGLFAASVALFSRNQTINREVSQVRQDNQDLETRYYSQVELERKVRLEYERSVSAIKRELDQLYRQEVEQRGLVGKAELKKAQGDFWSFDFPGLHLPWGEGGSADDPEDVASEFSEAVLNAFGGFLCEAGAPAPFQVQPAADLPETYDALVADVLKRADQIARLPATVPTSSPVWFVTSSFGFREDPFTDRLRRHKGTDIAAPRGTAVLATARGTVVYARYHRTLGWTVRLDHGNGIETLYGHLHRFFVSAGDRIERGDVIGELGNSGNSTGPHIHYEVRVHNQPVNPGLFFQD